MKIQLLAFCNASDSVKMILMMLADAHGAKSRPRNGPEHQANHQDISGMCGLTRETATRVLDRYIKSGEITIVNNKLVRLNQELEMIFL